MFDISLFNPKRTKYLTPEIIRCQGGIKSQNHIDILVLFGLNYEIKSKITNADNNKQVCLRQEDNLLKITLTAK